MLRTEVFDTETYPLQFPVHLCNNTWDLQFSPDKPLLAYASRLGARVWDTALRRTDDTAAAGSAHDGSTSRSKEAVYEVGES